MAHGAPPVAHGLVQRLAALQCLRRGRRHPRQQGQLHALVGLVRWAQCPPRGRGGVGGRVRRRGGHDHRAGERHGVQLVGELVLAARHHSSAGATVQRGAHEGDHRVRGVARVRAFERRGGEGHQRDGVDGDGGRRPLLLGECAPVRFGGTLHCFGEAAVDGAVAAGAVHQCGRAVHQAHSRHEVGDGDGGRRVVLQGEVDTALDLEEEQVDAAAHLAVDAVAVVAVGQFAQAHVEVGVGRDGDDEQAQFAAGVELAGHQQRREAHDGVEAGSQFGVEPGRLAAPQHGHVKAGGDGEAGGGRQVVGHVGVGGGPVAGEHQVAAAREHLQHLGADGVLELADVDVPLLGLVGVEERLHRDAQFQDGRDGEVDDDADGERVLGDVQVHHRQQRALGVALQRLGRRHQQVGLHHQQHARPGQLQQQHALQVEDDVAAHGAQQGAHTERPVVHLWLPQVRVLDLGGVAAGSLQPAQGDGGRALVEFLVALEVHGEQAHQPVQAEARRAERDGHRELHLEGDGDRGGAVGWRLLRAEVAHVQRRGHAQLHGHDGEVDATGEPVLVDAEVARAGERAGDVDAGAERGELHRGRVVVQPHAHAALVERHDAQVHRSPELDLEHQRVGARDLGAQHLQDGAERFGHFQRAAAGDVERVALRRVEHGPEDRRAVGCLTEADADGLVAGDQWAGGIDLDDRLATELDVGRHRGLQVGQDRLRPCAVAVHGDQFAAVPDDTFHLHPTGAGEQDR